MNYIKTLLQFKQPQIIEQNTSPDLSGQFQIIDLDQVQAMTQQNDKKQQSNHIRKSAVSVNDIQDRTSQTHQCVQNQGQNKQQQNDQKTEEQQLVNQKLSKQYTVIQLNQQDYEDKQEQCPNGSASTIKINQYYMIVSTQQLNKKFQTLQEWEQFFVKIREFHQEYNCHNSSSIMQRQKRASADKRQMKICLNLRQVNSILELKSEQTKLRQRYWSQIAHSSHQVRFKYSQLSNKKDPQKLQKNLQKIMDTLAPSIMYEIIQRKLRYVQNVQIQLQRWKQQIRMVLTKYGANDKQIGYSKGLEYLALGILVARPGVKGRLICEEGDDEKENVLISVSQAQQNQNSHANSHLHSNDDQKHSQLKNQTIINQNNSINSPILSSTASEYICLENHFKYLLFTLQLRNMYFPGTPKLYEQIELLSQLMRNEVSQLYIWLQSQKVDFIKLFINYYKTFLMYRLKNPQVIRKIMELLIVYGLDIVRVVITRIMNRNQKEILAMAVKDQIEMCKYLAESLIQDYFGNSDSQEVTSKFKQLFILDMSE